MNQFWSGMNLKKLTLTTTATGSKCSQKEANNQTDYQSHKELTHSQQHPQAPKTHKKKPTIRQAIRTVFCAPKGLVLTDTWSWMKSSASKTHTQQQSQLMIIS